MPGWTGMLEQKRTGPDGRLWILKSRDIVEGESAYNSKTESNSENSEDGEVLF